MPAKFVSSLRVARVRAGYTQPELAKKVRTTQTLLSKYERGLAVPKLDVARKLEEVLGQSIDQLFPRPAASKRRVNEKVTNDSPAA